MSTKRLKPDTPSRRFNVVPTFDEITKSKPERKLTVALKKTGGIKFLEKLEPKTKVLSFITDKQN